MLDTDTRTALWKSLAHGDDDHRQWLGEAIEAFFTDQPVPPPYGSGNKEALIAQLQAENASLRNGFHRILSTEDNPTGRKYPRSALKMAFNELTTSEPTYVSLDANEDMQQHPERYCAKVVEARLVGSNGVTTLEVRIEPLPTPCGMILKALLAEKVSVKCYASGSGVVGKNNEVRDYQFHGVYVSS